MLWSYGAYTSALNEARITIPASELLRTKFGIVYAVRKSIQIVGRIAKADRATMLSTVATLKSACSADYGNFSWKYGDTTESGESILNADTLSGIKAGPIVFPNGEGGEMSTFRNYQWSLEYTQVVGSLGNLIIEFSETVSHENPNAEGDYTYIPLAEERWQKQDLYPYGLHKLTQSGTVVGLTDYPAVPSPLYTSSPPWKKSLTKRSRSEPRVIEPGVRLEFPVEYSYTFESNSPLLPEAEPTVLI